MNRGALEFKALGVAPKIWAARLGVSVVTAESWRAGRRTPGADTRRAIHEDWNGPVPAAWDELVDVAPPRTVREPVAVVPATPEAVEGEAAKLLAHLRQLQDDLAAAQPEAHDLPQRIRMAESIAGSIARLGQITGTRISTRAILASPAWAELVKDLTAALEPWPDAMRAVADVLEPKDSPS
jgi:hypothetical protein